MQGFGDIIIEKLLSDSYVLFLVTAVMFFDESKIPLSVLCRAPQETFTPSLFPIGQVVSEGRFLKEKTCSKRAITLTRLNRIKRKFSSC